jgi:hypothetical protein
LRWNLPWVRSIRKPRCSTICAGLDALGRVQGPFEGREQKADEFDVFARFRLGEVAGAFRHRVLPCAAGCPSRRASGGTVRSFGAGP